MSIWIKTRDDACKLTKTCVDIQSEQPVIAKIKGQSSEFSGNQTANSGFAKKNIPGKC